MKFSFMCFSQKSAVITGNDERGLIFVDIMISRHCSVIWCISIAYHWQYSYIKILLSVLYLLKQAKKELYFLIREIPETKLRYRNVLHRTDHLCLIVREMLEIILTPSDSLSSLTAVHIRSEVLKLLQLSLQRCKVVVLQSNLAAEPC